MNLEQYRDAMKNAPKLIRQASANALNEMGFMLRDDMAKSITNTMTVRRPGMFKHFLQVQKTRAVWIEQQRVVVGSIKEGKFRGWLEEEEGLEQERDRTFSLFSRGGGQAGVVKPRNKVNQPILTADQAGITGTEGNRTMGLLAYARRQAYTGLIQLDGEKYKGSIVRLKPGVWKAVKKRTGWAGKAFGETVEIPKFQTVQHRKKFKVAKKPWRDKATHMLLGNTNTRELWKQGMKKALEKAKARG